MSEDSRGGDTLLAFLLGGALGLAAGLFFAPRTGKETRRRFRKWMEELEDKGEDLLEQGREWVEEGKEAVKEKADQLRRAVDGGRKPRAGARE